MTHHYESTSVNEIGQNKLEALKLKESSLQIFKGLVTPAQAYLI